MTAIKRIISLTLCIFVLLGLCSCNAKESIIDSISDFQANDEIEKGIDKIGYSIPYIRTDSLNPYVAKEQINLAVSTLLYDSLFAVSNSFEPLAQIASSYSVDGKKITVAIKTTLKFSDGSPLTADDIIYSFEIAKKSDNYKSFLTNITDAKAGEKSVVFTLDYKNENEVANLFFPVIKKDSDKAAGDSVSDDEILPIGSGRYTLKEDNAVKFLEYNKSRLGSYHPEYNKVGLTDVTSSDSVQNSIQDLFSLGSVDFYTNDYSSGEFSNYTGVGQTYNMTNFVYLGINSEAKSIGDGRVRRAIAMIISRNDLTKVSFAGNAVATSTPFHPDYFGVKGCTLPALKDNVEAGISLLEEAGYKDVNSSDVRYNSKTNRSLNLSLLVNKENSFKVSMARSIQQSLAKANISVTLKEYSYKRYVEAVEEGSYSMYIGEARLSNSFDLTRFFSENGSLNYGIDMESKTAGAYEKFKNNDISMQNFLDVFADELPLIPVAYRQGLTIKSSKISTDISANASDCFYNIEDWKTE